MSVRIEVGKRYVRRDGEITGNAEAVDEPDGFYSFVVDGYYHSETGLTSRFGERGVDIVAEYTETSFNTIRITTGDSEAD